MTTQNSSAQTRLPTLFSTTVDDHIEKMQGNNELETPNWLTKPSQAEKTDRIFCESFLRQSYALAM